MKAVEEKIRAAHSAAILGHINADPDSIGSCAAFAHMLRRMGKEAVVYMEEPIEKRLEFICSDYVIYNEETAAEHDLCVCLDCGDMGRLGNRRVLFDRAKATVNIDHHGTNTRFADVNLVDAGASAAGEILCGLFRGMNAELDEEAARYLYIAICSDTGCFKFDSVSPKTMRETAGLLEYGFDHADIAKRLFDTHSLEETVFLSYIMREIRSYDGGKIKVVSVPEGLCAKVGMEEKDIPNVVDIPRCVEGTEIAVALRMKKGEVRVNLRSNGEADVSRAALKFGGGGHVRAAGAGIKGVSLEEAERLVVEACREALG